ncbi:hypothetical protein [Methylobacterium sp. J-067]|uniref:hypothetical protein n=1 Tax=Methylobacterium sp. J-067 TaxID=2836648 RepID=UPI001FBA514F|nr:hypothetical protein [Methylobacterium sp. J-067]MCJ2023998.1 hypothetical protein [Methylobacterium sp. J-067]
MTGIDPIPAIREEDAQGETATMFADLRASLGVPFVNLIWRNLATIPGGLAWTWTLVKPLYASQDLAAAAADLRGMVRLPDLEPVPGHAWDAAGLEAEARTTILGLVANYNHANSLNFLAMLVARSVLRGEGEGQDAPASAAVPAAPAPPEPTPRLLAMSELSPPVLRLVQDLDGFGRLGDNEAIASLYRHLAHWPPYLAMARTALLPLHRSGFLAAEQRRLIEAGQRHAVGLVRHAARVPTLETEATGRALPVIEAFTRLMIGRMIVMGTALQTLVAAQPAGQPPAREDRPNGT